jgi:hypothetical protein
VKIDELIPISSVSDRLPSTVEELLLTIKEQDGLIKNLQLAMKILKEDLDSYEREFSKAKPVSTEEQICIDQIRLLNEKSRNDELDFEDAKKFEIYHKNLRLARGLTVDGGDSRKKPPRKLSTAQLIDLASTPE